MGEAKYDFSSFCAIAMMLPIDDLSCGCLGSRCQRLRFLGRQRQEDVLEAQTHRPQFQQSPSVGDYCAREIPPHITSLLALDFVTGDAVLAIGLGDADDAGDAVERRGGI